MDVRFALNSRKSIEALNPDFQRAVHRVTETMSHANSLSELLRSLDTESTTFEQTPVFIAKVNPFLRLVFTEKNNKVFILSLIKKDQ